MDELRRDAEKLRDEAKGRTFEPLGETSGALGTATGAVKAADHGKPNATKQLDAARAKIGYAQDSIDDAVRELGSSSDDASVSMTESLKALGGELDTLAGSLTAR